MDYSFQAIIEQHTREMQRAFNNLIETILQCSKLSISLLRISNVTEDSFNVSLEAFITRTGPVQAKISEMTVDLHGPEGQFGTITLPAIATQAYGTDVVITSQTVKIIDKKALQAFIHAIIDGSSVVLSLRNGRTSISAMRIAPCEVTYEKDIRLPGMNGPIVNVQSAEVIQTPSQLSDSRPASAAIPNDITSRRSSTTASVASITGLSGRSDVSIVLRIANPSPLEINFGMCFFEIQDHENEILAELKGCLDIHRNYVEIMLQGNVNKAVAITLAAEISEAVDNFGTRDKKNTTKQIPGARLVGKQCAGAGWCDDTIKTINVPLEDMHKLFRALDFDSIYTASDEKGADFTKWTQG
ncbi:hypothetical protein GGS21DRAFT_296420 [Xylaria nigripes]|nr:hypothetical protein GGS21DRAFT_296420 [Xylaria nigripes]